MHYRYAAKYFLQNDICLFLVRTELKPLFFFVALTWGKKGKSVDCCLGQKGKNKKAVLFLERTSSLLNDPNLPMFLLNKKKHLLLGNPFFVVNEEIKRSKKLHISSQTNFFCFCFTIQVGAELYSTLAIVSKTPNNLF